ncbi:hypothetical protein N431DRAFT_321278 [Stipitochalara longipes BDJ]|nr:hypothetical protein N431DRAFT_321278 [Stipitochalara longipes BDJ]
MSITSVFPPSTTPGGWFGCFGPPSIVATNVPVAWPVSGQLPCGNGTVESCCIIGDQCLSNGVCQILPVANNGQDPLYYGAYCTDPTFSSPECAANCAVKYMAYCGYNDIWQCGNTDRKNPISCNTSDITTSDSSTFFMIEPTKLAKGSILPSTEPTTAQTQYIPTQWGKPEATTLPTSIIASSSMTSTIILPSITSVSTTRSFSSSPVSSPSGSSSSGLSAGDDAGIAIGIITLVVTIVGVWIAWKQYKKKASTP